MALPVLSSARGFQSVVAGHTLLLGQIAWYRRSELFSNRRQFASQPAEKPAQDEQLGKSASFTSSSPPSSPSSGTTSPVASSSGASSVQSLPADWEDQLPNLDDFSQLPHKDFGKNQLIETNEEFKRSLRQITRQFPAITYSFAYGSGVFPQTDGSSSSTSLSPHPNPPEAISKWQRGGGKMIDFIFATKFTEHFHSLNLMRHRDHYSFLGSFGSSVVSHVQDSYGAGAYFNPYITVNGTLIKYGVVNFSTLLRDLTDWDTLYLAGRLHKPVKILTEEPNIRVANQRNLMAAVRCALLLLPPQFTERELYTTIASLSYQGDPRMALGSEHPNKIANIVTHQIRNFRLLYSDLINSLPNVDYAESSSFKDASWIDDLKLDRPMTQNMETAFRGNMVRRLPKSFRQKLYFLYQRKFGIPGREFQEMLEASADEDAKGSLKKPLGSDFDRRVASEADLPKMVAKAVNQTVKWPSAVQSLKSGFTAGPGRALRYVREKRAKGKQ
ncbi:mitochondrial import protein mmp37 [Lophium mytilinum]|uniref:Phosphatidate cytidylyltransferase, mitochondrial n=1 Tax=Lophium mytilinum TaxID=390894 RepID=A0A6A6QMP1_9PEZI|nr:mitochondrial import protein mmp37 [Lophium mytilinum]